jgi:hypothetical protein
MSHSSLWLLAQFVALSTTPKMARAQLAAGEEQMGVSINGDTQNGWFIRGNPSING